MSLLALSATTAGALLLLAWLLVRLLNAVQAHADDGRLRAVSELDRAADRARTPWRYHDAEGRARSALPVADLRTPYSSN